MALNIPMLTSQIYAVFQQQLADTGKVASRIARAYQAYAAGAQSPPGGLMILTGSESRQLEQTIKTICDNNMPPGPAAQLIGQAITTFWLTPPVLNASGGAVTAIVPAAGIAKLASINEKDIRASAQSFAQAFDMITRTVFVVNPSPLPFGHLF